MPDDLRIITAPTADDLGEDLEGVVARDLRDLTERLARAGLGELGGGALGGRYGYGVDFENDRFRMHVYCYDSDGGCPHCNVDDDGNETGWQFEIKPQLLGGGPPVRVRWYKWIGRSQVLDPPALNGAYWKRMLAWATVEIPQLPPPKRIQLSRAKGWRKPEGTIVVSRPGRWGNPFRVCERYPTREAAVEAFRALLEGMPDLVAQARRELRGRSLACWCPLPAPGEPDVCHARVLIEVANS